RLDTHAFARQCAFDKHDLARVTRYAASLGIEGLDLDDAQLRHHLVRRPGVKKMAPLRTTERLQRLTHQAQFARVRSLVEQTAHPLKTNEHQVGVDDVGLAIATN